MKTATITTVQLSCTRNSLYNQQCKESERNDIFRRGTEAKAINPPIRYFKSTSQIRNIPSHNKKYEVGGGERAELKEIVSIHWIRHMHTV